jgi:hypothetical protein
MGKLEDLEMVADMVGLDYGYVVEATTYFTSMEDAFNWLYLSEDNPNRPYDQSELVKVLSSISIEQMEELGVKTVAEYMVHNDDHTYIGKSGIAYLRIQR